MDDKILVAIVVLICGTSLGVVRFLTSGDGEIMAGMLGLYGAILGYVFGTRTTTQQITSTPQNNAGS